MTGRWWLDAAIGAAAALVVCWLLLIAALYRGNRRNGGNMAEAFRLLPDLVRLLRRVAVDRSLSVGVRVRIWAAAGLSGFADRPDARHHPGSWLRRRRDHHHHRFAWRRPSDWSRRATPALARHRSRFPRAGSARGHQRQCEWHPRPAQLMSPAGRGPSAAKDVRRRLGTEDCGPTSGRRATARLSRSSTSAEDARSRRPGRTTAPSRPRPHAGETESGQSDRRTDRDQSTPARSLRARGCHRPPAAAP